MFSKSKKNFAPTVILVFQQIVCNQCFRVIVRHSTRTCNSDLRAILIDKTFIHPRKKYLFCIDPF